MTDIKDLNNSEYRWYHKEEMSKIMPFPTERKRLGIKIINYDDLRDKNDSKIKINKERFFNWEIFKRIVENVPYDLNHSIKKKPLQPKDRLHFEKRAKGVCFICGQINNYGSYNKYSIYDYKGTNVSHLHHIIPNGDVDDGNIITLCLHCHQLVHLTLYLTGRWTYGMPL